MSYRRIDHYVHHYDPRFELRDETTEQKKLTSTLVVGGIILFLSVGGLGLPHFLALLFH